MEKKTIGSIYSTNEYSQFKILGGNRQLNQLHLQRLLKSVESKQLICPIIVNDKMEIIDGQHRLQVFKELKLPVYYIIIDGYGLPECQQMNMYNKVWKPDDFLSGYADLGMEQYIKFQEFKRKYDFLSAKMCQIYLSGGQSDKYIGQHFKEGKFEIKDYDRACNWAEKTLDFKFYEPFSSTNFQLALIQCFKHPEYDHSRMLMKLSYQSSYLRAERRVEDYKRTLTEIYNYRAKMDEKVYFYEK